MQRARRGAAAAGLLPVEAVADLPPPRAGEDVLLHALVRHRAGQSADSVRSELEAFDRRQLRTAFGPRSPAQALSVPPLAARFALFCKDTASPRPEALARLRRAVADDPVSPEPWLRLAALRDPQDFDLLMRARDRAGRRGDHALIDALGAHGDPRALGVLRDALHARDVDPGRGFTQRRLAADGIGRLGLAAGAPLLSAALRDERADFEGRPGAGLGVQYPVRANLLWALGELGAGSAVPDLVHHLGDSTGSAFGGFYLPAMDALWRVGAPARPALERAARTAPEVAAANAIGVLLALGDPPDRWRQRRGERFDMVLAPA
jgi:HEAT repeat protein